MKKTVRMIHTGGAMRNYSTLVWLHSIYRGNAAILRRLDELVRSQWMPAEKIRTYQLAQVRELIRYAGDRIPYYRSLFRRIGLSGPEDIRTLDDLASIPPLTKAIIRAELDSLTAQRDDLQENHTGGSTGVPLRFYGDAGFMHVDKPAASFRAYAMGGYRPGDSIAKIWGFDKDLSESRGLRGIVQRRIYKRYELNTFSMTPQRVDQFLKEMNRRRIAFIRGYATSLVDIARYMMLHQVFPAHQIRAVFSEAERLDDHQRESIETAFRARVFNYYGCREFGTIATECDRHNGLHENFEQLLTEVQQDGKVLITSFRNRGTVFLRYEVGDNVECVHDGQCACGRSSKRLAKVLGRETDNFIAPSGTIVHGEYVTHLFYGTRAIEQFQIVQHAPTQFTLSVVTTDPVRAREEIAGIVAQLNRKFDAALSVQVEFVHEIAKTRTGKRKFTIRNIPTR